MAGERILYVCFDPAMLVGRERLLMTQGYEVRTVLGHDGLLGSKQLSDFDFILIGDEGSLVERQNSARLLRERHFPPPIIALFRDTDHVMGADFEVSTGEPRGWCDSLADCIRRCQQ